MLEVRNLTRRFGDLVAVNNLSFVVPDGSFTGFVGGNGAGKTTTMRMIMGLTGISEGEVLWNGSPITREQRAQIGYMPEERGLYPKQPILDQLVYLGELYGMPRAEAKQEATDLMTSFGLGERLKDKLETLSLGNQQRVQIAAAVMGNPNGLVLDEPFSGLDPDAVDEMVARMETIRARNVPILFSSHQLDLVERLCDHIVILRKGELVASGTVRELKNRTEPDFKIVSNADLGWLRQVSGVSVVDLDGHQALVRFSNDQVSQQVLREVMARGAVYNFGPVDRPLSDIYREVNR